MRILYAVGSWGLGHSTRSLQLITSLQTAGAAVTVVSTGRALILLRRELGTRCEFVDWPDVPQTISRSALGFYLRSAAAIPLMIWRMVRESQWTTRLVAQQHFDRIVSDNRYGVQHPRLPSFHIANSLRFIAPGRIRAIEFLLESFNYRWFSGLRKVIVPDTVEDALTGDLTHHLRVFPPSLVAYVGIISSIRSRPLPQDIDLFISVSGPEPQRTILERTVLQQLGATRARVVATLGKPEAPGLWRSNGCEIHGHLDREAQEEMMNRARVVLARPGYSTISELAELERRAVLVPTPGQTEQVYLAAYHDARGAVRGVDQRRLDLWQDVALAASRPGLRARVKTTQAVERAVALILNG